MRKIILSATLAALMTGCASNGMPTISADIPNHIEAATHKMFVGLPGLAALEGSFVSIGDGWAVTAAHNKWILESTGKDAVYHDKCDIALFKYESGSNVELGALYAGQTVHNSGYPLMMPLAYNSGEYVIDVFVEDSFPDCLQSASTAVTMSGMSGGGVWNELGQLVGVVSAVNRDFDMPDGSGKADITVFQALAGVGDWIEEITGMQIKY